MAVRLPSNKLADSDDQVLIGRAPAACEYIDGGWYPPWFAAWMGLDIPLAEGLR